MTTLPFTTPITTAAGTTVSLAEYSGSALLIVNVASRCGLTPQYAQLEELQRTYGQRGLQVLGFPCNQFGGQEPGTNDEIAAFCSATYGVSFPVLDKVEVNGTDRHPVYSLLTEVADADGMAGDVAWNFEKYLVAPDGEVVARFRPQTLPDDATVIAAIEEVLPR
ncbi:MAG: hypothetical protein JWQ43_4080 [Glaciihabitans sp.]|nr:hypothetical protein [Glaciihabitans sp.]